MIRRLQMLLCSLAVSYWAGLFIIPLLLLYGNAGGLISVPYLWEVLSLLLYTLPFYIAFLTLGSCIPAWISGNPQCSKGENILNIISCVVAVLILSTICNLNELLYPALAVSAFLVLLRIIIAAVYKKKTGMTSFIRQKSFWLCTLLTVLLVSVITFFASR